MLSREQAKRNKNHCWIIQFSICADLLAGIMYEECKASDEFNRVTTNT